MVGTAAGLPAANPLSESLVFPAGSWWSPWQEPSVAEHVTLLQPPEMLARPRCQWSLGRGFHGSYLFFSWPNGEGCRDLPVSLSLCGPSCWWGLISTQAGSYFLWQEPVPVNNVSCWRLLLGTFDHGKPANRRLLQYRGAAACSAQGSLFLFAGKGDVRQERESRRNLT